MNSELTFEEKEFNKTIDLFQDLMKAFAPPPPLTVSEWADTYRRLSPETSAEPGKWNTSRAKYQKAIMDSISDKHVWKVVLMTSAQIGKALDVDTPIPTPYGWTTMGKLKKGDKVYDECGNKCNVIFATEYQYERKCYKCIFSAYHKGHQTYQVEPIVADADHKWTVHLNYNEVTLTTTSIMKYLKSGKQIGIRRKKDGMWFYFEEIYEVESRPVKCIQVDSKSSLYLAGKQGIPTHNTEMMLNALGYYIDYDPAPMLYVMPNDGLAGSFSKERLAPMIRDCPTLRNKVQDIKSRATGNTIMNKQFPGGYIALVGANAPSSLSSRPIRIVLMDEVDRFPASAGTEGDPVQLAVKRTNTFWNRKIIEVSTPTLKGASKIEKEYESSSMEELHIACPCCGHYQPYVWEQLKFEHESGTKNFKLLGYRCNKCGEISKEIQWKRQPIKWVAQHPEIKDVRGFHLNELASPWKRWEEIIADFLEAKRQGREAMIAWHNTSLGLSWEETSDLSIKDILARRRKFYNCPPGTFVPKDCLVLTCGVDTQDNRLEYEIVGWGTDKRSWGIKYGVLYGDPGQEEVWRMLDEVVLATYKREDGIDMPVWTTCVDYGGHHSKEVAKYAKKRELNRVWAIRGEGGSGKPFVLKPKRRNDDGIYLFRIGVDVGKDTMASRLKTDHETEPGFCFFPMEAERGYDERYFEGLTSERKVIRTVNGAIKVSWVTKYEGIRNEPWDLRNYATAALEILNPNLDYLHRMYNEEGYKMPEPKKRKRGKANKGIEI